MLRSVKIRTIQVVRESGNFTAAQAFAPSDHRSRIVLDLGRRLKVVLLILGWATSLAAFTLQAIFQGSLLPSTALAQPGNITSPLAIWIFYVGILSASLLAAFLLEDAGRAIISLFISYLLADVIIYVVIAMPGYVGGFPYSQVLFKSAISFVFAGSFPIPLLLEILGTISGIALAERFS